MVRPAKRPRVAPDPNDTSTWYTRGEVAEILNVHRSTVVNYEERGRLHAQVDIRGVHRFDPVEVRALLHNPTRKRRPHEKTRPLGTIEADVFSMLNQGFSRREIVLRLQITSEQADLFHEHWKCETFEQAARAEHQRLQLQRQQEDEERRREEERKQQEEFDRQMREIQENNARLVAAATGVPTPGRKK